MLFYTACRMTHPAGFLFAGNCMNISGWYFAVKGLIGFIESFFNTNYITKAAQCVLPEPA
jgi:hypothetical protein